MRVFALCCLNLFNFIDIVLFCVHSHSRVLCWSLCRHQQKCHWIHFHLGAVSPLTETITSAFLQKHLSLLRVTERGWFHDSNHGHK